jgi:hypothetical protein
MVPEFPENLLPLPEKYIICMISTSVFN